MKLFMFSKNIDNKMAHKNGMYFETFYEHVEKTEKYLERIIDKFDLERILGNLFSEIGIDSSHIQTIKEIIKYHDIGKLTDEFQEGLIKGKIKVTHSDVGFYTIATLLTDKLLSENLKKDEFLFLFFLSTVVSRHHSVLFDIDKVITWNENKEKFVKDILENIETINDKGEIVKKTKQVFEKIKQLKIYKKIEFYILYKLINSLLITSDYLATLEFMKGVEISINAIDKTLKKAILENISSRNIEGNFNPYIDENFDRLKAMKKENISDINTLRSVMAARVEEKFKNSNKKVFFIEIPTGGGKTNISLRLISRLLENKKKVFYVIPFINIIEQNFEYFSKFIPKEHITRYDHKYLNVTDDENKEKTFTQMLFLNFPFVFSTHVGFFDMFFRNGKSDNFNFYQLANSVVVLDEVQAYNPKFWNTLSNLFYYLSKYLNTTIIIMSATLPDFTKFVDKGSFVEDLSPDVVEHKIFNRVNTLFLKENHTFEEKVLEEINESKKVLIVVNTVKKSYEIYENLEDKINGEIYLLNSTLLDIRKKELIDYIKSYDKEKPLILVSTQSIEAGVDLDFDVGFRAFSILDSIIQTMGRVNRNARLSRATLYLFDDGMWKKIYGSDVRKKILEENFSKFKNGSLTLKDFYMLTIENLKKKINK
ncbi:CRISPR-associated protein Cas3 [Thermosipho melanesiensis]|uniref:CRISPR-associated helicase Cas3 n=1 Tax=Thermosipho melanesiensis (strain DSM 12029 / CIP 104789 / BI429) TaxID=391009 RepID=A6LJX0_THEM4|nr:CRISPR-associated helicase/endonuclease Cas3 [Thermosipho melanesiensis]ABR30221.1 CRISPR-associated helicase Cas3 [Thermosipho melanesiensis BI429]OOC37355.1 CRISPR-associated protein Cas3 [Thermosipho melanesiensis]OOC39717.1 CRISPR-associated protein Cas3 [Thermosipho melanesiensis]OOC39822.1 CRISPR-associated protein Cas3 [Thermosipho melanesiensis]OOC43750.1 CRISPR-associated protein Cas3 [Thermosipho melanesiensis]